MPDRFRRQHYAVASGLDIPAAQTPRAASGCGLRVTNAGGRRCPRPLSVDTARYARAPLALVGADSHA
jgi:hypothetical protein